MNAAARADKIRRGGGDAPRGSTRKTSKAALKGNGGGRTRRFKGFFPVSPRLICNAAKQKMADDVTAGPAARSAPVQIKVEVFPEGGGGAPGACALFLLLSE